MLGAGATRAIGAAAYRSLDMTAHYAKVDAPMLETIAPPGREKTMLSEPGPYRPHHALGFKFAHRRCSCALWAARRHRADRVLAWQGSTVTWQRRNRLLEVRRFATRHAEDGRHEVPATDVLGVACSPAGSSPARICSDRRIAVAGRDIRPLTYATFRLLAATGMRISSPALRLALLPTMA
jgi:hypothetical protein